MDIMSLFRSAPKADAVPPQPNGNPSQVANPGQPLPGTQATPQTAANGLVPTQVTPPVDTTPKSPFDGLEKFWENPANTTVDESGTLFSQVDPAKLLESARKVNFAAPTQEQTAALLAGGEGAVKATIDLVNSAVQSAFAQSAFATTKIVDSALSKSRESLDSRIPNLIKKHSVAESLAEQNPALNHPVMAPVIEAMRDQLIRKNPNATAAEIRSQLNEITEKMATVFAPKQVETAETRRAAKVRSSEDFSNWDV